MDKVWSIHTVNIICSLKNEVLIPVTMQVNLENIRLSEEASHKIILYDSIQNG